MTERLGDLAGDAARGEARALRDARRHSAHGKDAVLMHVLDWIIAFARAALAAHHNDRHFPLEAHQAFEHGGDTANRSPSALSPSFIADQHLSLAVVAEAPSLKQRRKCHGAYRCAQISEA